MTFAQTMRPLICDKYCFTKLELTLSRSAVCLFRDAVHIWVKFNWTGICCYADKISLEGHEKLPFRDGDLNSLHYQFAPCKARDWQNPMKPRTWHAFMHQIAQSCGLQISYFQKVCSTSGSGLLRALMPSHCWKSRHCLAQHGIKERQLQSDCLHLCHQISPNSQSGQRYKHHGHSSAASEIH